MNKVFLQFLGYFAIIFAADQLIKWLFLQGFRWQSDFIDLVLVYNKGVAFSMLAFLEGNLKYLQIALITLLVIYLIKQKELLKLHTAAFGLILGSGCSNIFDRFIHPGVVDYIFWHKWFEFAVFNFADIMINLGVAIILLQTLIQKKAK
ncbi:signal peptidase II [Campylobacter devanensis]|uniref:signal peptidase II n=1 Tax=Campylobacter devanensis TaxID=3161138 RepID=UPI000A342072|nr:signal peptidase II [Campylobacter sp. P0138]